MTIYQLKRTVYLDRVEGEYKTVLIIKPAPIAQKLKEITKTLYTGKLSIFDERNTRSDSYCEHVSGKMLIFLRFLGFFLSYITIYISRPKRIYKLLKSVFQKKFFADNLFEQRIYEFYLRAKLKKQQKKLAANNY